MSRLNKAPKDKNAPKKSQSSYFIYSNKRRSEISKEKPEMKVTDISKVISKEWKAMSADTKQIYIDLAKEAKAKYDEVFGEYKQTQNYKTHQEKLAAWKQEQKDRKKSMTKQQKAKAPKKPKQPALMPKRPNSSYFIFSNERRPELQQQYPDKKVTELASLISAEWKTKTAEEKKHYEQRAAVEKQKYNDVMENYKQLDEYKNYMAAVKQFKEEKKAFDQGLMLNGTDSGDVEYKVSLPRKPKDPKCPKRPLSSYFLYANKVREEVTKANPNLKITQIAGVISGQWKLLTDEEKLVFNEQAKELKGHYNERIAKYKESDDFTAFQQTLQNWKNECAKRKKAAKEKYEAALKKANAHSHSKKKKSASKKKSKKYESDSDSESSSESDSSSGSHSDSSSGSGSNSGSDSDSDSDSSSE